MFIKNSCRFEFCKRRFLSHQGKNLTEHKAVSKIFNADGAKILCATLKLKTGLNLSSNPFSFLIKDRKLLRAKLLLPARWDSRYLQTL